MRPVLVLTMCLFGASAVLMGGCTPKAGATCKAETKEACLSEKLALACHDGKWEEMPCLGTSGCTKNGNESTCDQSVAEEKDVCNLAGDLACAADKKSVLECTKNRWSFWQSCLGDRGCTLDNKKVACDNVVASEGDACHEEEDYACSVDKKSALVCRGGKFTVASSCRGKSACRIGPDKIGGSKVECDDSVALPGDTCDKEGHYTCSPDEKGILKCVAKKFVADDRCKKNEKCVVKGDLVGCY